jgi:hypothetical protein
MAKRLLVFIQQKFPQINAKINGRNLRQSSYKTAYKWEDSVRDVQICCWQICKQLQSAHLSAYGLANDWGIQNEGVHNVVENTVPPYSLWLLFNGPWRCWLKWQKFSQRSFYWRNATRGNGTRLCWLTNTGSVEENFQILTRGNQLEKDF